MTFQLIDHERSHHAVSLLCSVLNVTRQGFWAWKRRGPSARRCEDERLKRLIADAWEAHLRGATRTRRAEARSRHQDRP